MGDGCGLHPRDCSAAPALFYADKVISLKGNTTGPWLNLERLKARASFARTLKEAEPFFSMFPTEKT